MKQYSSIVKLSVSKVHPHPNNPRKDVGDVTELAESIKKNGIMQNMTVIPGYWKDGKFIESETEYTLIIGHRRYAAAKMAGLLEVPCRIYKDMSEKEQMATMLEENMQRSDLTILEQAEGFQMMLDLGETAEGIAEKTGFSTQTVNHRVQMAKLDKKRLKEIEKDDGFQLTLKDLYTLEGIEDVKVRNKILQEARDSRDLKWKVETEKKNILKAKNLEVLKKLAEAAGLEKAPKDFENNRYSGKYEIVKEYYLDQEPPKKLQNTSKECFWSEYYGRFTIGRKVIKKEEKREKTPQELERERIEGNRKNLNKIISEMYKRMTDFIDAIVSKKVEPVKDEAKVIAECWEFLLKNWTYGSPEEKICKALYGKEAYNCTQEQRSKVFELNTVNAMLASVVGQMDKSTAVANWNAEYQKREAENLITGMKILEQYGWSITEAEAAVLDGTNEMFTKKGE